MRKRQKPPKKFVTEQRDKYRRGSLIRETRRKGLSQEFLRVPYGLTVKE